MVGINKMDDIVGAGNLIYRKEYSAAIMLLTQIEDKNITTDSAAMKYLNLGIAYKK